MEESNPDKENSIVCPSCNADIKPLKFCTRCGTSLKESEKCTSNSISEKLKEKKEQSDNFSPTDDETIDSIKKSGKGLMKGVGGLMNKTKKQINPGYLVCDNCGGSYKLAKDEKPEDFSDECECGGKFKHKIKP